MATTAAIRESLGDLGRRADEFPSGGIDQIAAYVKSAECLRLLVKDFLDDPPADLEYIFACTRSGCDIDHQIKASMSSVVDGGLPICRECGEDMSLI